MRLYHEEILDKEKVLFIYSKKTNVVNLLSSPLKKSGIDVYASSTLPSNLNIYKYIFFFEKLPARNNQQVIPSHFLITSNRKHESLAKKNPQSKLKIILISKHVSGKDIDTIMEFVFSSNNELLLDLSYSLKRSPTKDADSSGTLRLQLPSRRKLILTVLAIFFLFEVSFLVPLGIASVFLYKTIRQVRSNNIEQATQEMAIAKPFLDASTGLYGLARPTLSFFSLALLPDSLMSSAQNTYIISRSGIDAEQRVSQVVESIMTPDKTPDQISQTRTDIAYLKRDIKTLRESTLELTHNLDTLPIKIPRSIEEKLDSALLTMEQIEQLTSSLDTALGSDKEQKYVLFFYNNMELRPGGGFLGSFATVKFNDYTMKDLVVYDVYDADGQLEAHIEPPTAIRDYLEQPHWFLRDSNFSPDFPENVKNAQIFLEKEMGFTNFDGAIGITTTGITNLISAFGTIYLPDYQETVDKNNFYLKTQEHSQTNFFPGSTQKKGFLSALLHTMLLHAKEVNKGAVGQQLLKSLDEKHIVLNFTDQFLQTAITKAGWSGSVLQSECVKSATCISNTLLPVDANLGVNKANFFVSRKFDISTRIASDGTIHNTFTSRIQNDSPDNSFGGEYKNFFRLYIPRSASIRGVLIDNKPTQLFEEKSTAYFKVVEILITTKKRSSSSVAINYTLNQKLKNGKNTYQVAVQKQIGSLNTGMHISLSMPRNITVTSKNFPALEKNGSITYNTTLSGNKIFILELIKQ